MFKATLEKDGRGVQKLFETENEKYVIQACTYINIGLGNTYDALKNEWLCTNPYGLQVQYEEFTKSKRKRHKSARKLLKPLNETSEGVPS